MYIESDDRTLNWYYRNHKLYIGISPDIYTKHMNQFAFQLVFE